MRILIVNTSEHTGGAAIAAARLREALGNNGVKPTMLVGEKHSETITVAEPHRKLLLRANFLAERIIVWAANKFRKHRLFEVDAASFGLDITGLDEFRQADVIHLHWINQGFLSLGSIRKILRSGKPIVWTLHDMWPFTGICHYTGTCERFTSECAECPVLYQGGGKRDLSHRVFRRKQALYQNANITFVACSDWLARQAASSALLRGKRVLSIPNPINTRLYSPQPKPQARAQLALPQDKTLLLFAAFRVTNKIKGIDYLCEAINLLIKEHPELRERLALVAVGKESDALKPLLPIDVYSMGYVANEQKMITIYNACDLFLIPTMQDNLPNTIMESMACGMPCVAFEVGGIPQMIDHKLNGYIARYKDPRDFAQGILWALEPQTLEALSHEARNKVGATFSETVVARKFTDLYQNLLGGKDE